MAHGLPAPEELLPHRGTALVLDELTELEPGVRAVGLWTPTAGYFDGHFPDEPILPGHWTTESTALAGACAIIAATPGVKPLFRESQSLFQRPVRLGDTLELIVDFEKQEELRGGLVVAQGSGKAKVNGTTVYTAKLLKAVWGGQA